jgi:hypothetical protein
MSSACWPDISTAGMNSAVLGPPQGMNSPNLETIHRNEGIYQQFFCILMSRFKRVT